jgi:hypothetical protein
MRRAPAATGGTFQAAPAAHACGAARRRLLAAIGALALVAACGDDGERVSPTTPSDVTGTYTLRRINNDSLPVVVEQTTGRRIELLSETLTLNADRTFTDVTDLRQTAGTAVTTATQRAAGTYIVNGTLVIFSYAPDNARATATYSNGSISMLVGGSTYLYRR